jgi:hypothetical protein
VRRRWLALGLAAVLLVALGVAIGRRSTEPGQPEARPAVTVTVPALEQETHAAGDVRIPEGAASAATDYLAALGGPAILDPAAVRRTLTAFASAGSRDDLVRAYEAAAAGAREQLGVGTDTDTAVVLRTVSVGYRIDGFHRGAATVSIWRVGIVGSGAVAPRQSWRTETLSLVWEDGAWKVDAVRSTPGPTPPLAGTATTPAELFAAIPRFEEFTGELP